MGSNTGTRPWRLVRLHTKGEGGVVGLGGGLSGDKDCPVPLCNERDGRKWREREEGRLQFN